MLWRRTVSALFAFAALGVLTLTSAAVAARRTEPAHARDLTASSPRLLGVMTDPWHADDYERALHTRVQVIENFMPWGENTMPTARLREAERRGLTPMIAWLPRQTTARADPHAIQPAFSNEAISAGLQDRYIARFARSLATFRGTVLLRYAPEFDGAWEPWHNDHDAYVAAWHRIYRIFQQQGATNVKFVWSPALPWQNYSGGFSGWLKLVREYWPGGNEVDYVGTTTVSHNGQPVSFFADRIRLLREFAKPVVLSEVYAPNWLRKRWLPEFAAMVNSMPFVRVVVWCDLNPELPITRSPSRGSFAAIAHTGS